MSSLVQSLDTPFERLAVLPTTMSWLGTWVAGTLYFKFNVVVSPADNALYILIGATTVDDSIDPSTSALWEEVVPTTTTGVTSVSGSAYINVDNTDPQNPVVSNTGVLTLIAQNGLQARGTEKNRIIVNTGVSQIGEGLGIKVAGNTISNTGLQGLAASTGILIPTGLGFEPTVINNGVVSLVAGFGMTVSDLPTARAGSAPFVSLNGPITTRFLNDTDQISDTAIPFDNVGLIPVPNGSNPNSILFKYINGTPPDATGGFLFDFNGWCFTVGPTGSFGFPQTGHTAQFSFFDSTTQKTYSSPLDVVRSTISTATPFYINIPPIFVPISALKAEGLTRITDIVVYNGYPPNGIYNYTIVLQSSAGTFATYYPTNIF